MLTEIIKPSVQNKMDAVLPLTASEFERFERLLMPSMQRFFHDLATCWIVTPPDDAELIARSITDERFKVISETELIPELTTHRGFLRRIGKATQAGVGWFIQQVIKLAIAKRVETPFYLTLDSDVLCVRDAYYKDLVQENRALTVIGEGDPHPGWYWWTEKVLKMPRSGRSHAVTPVVLSVEAVGKLYEYLRSRIKPGKEISVEGHLIRRLPWTEYSLYFTYLENAGLFDQYHFVADAPTLGNCVWHIQDFNEWNPAKSFNSPKKIFFTVVQSNTSIPVQEVVSKVRQYLK
jgi:hypothetical protein